MNFTDLDNPFYDNHIFTADDLNRRHNIQYIDLWEKIRVWFAPMLYQINGDYVWFFKIVNGKYFIFKHELLIRRYKK